MEEQQTLKTVAEAFGSNPRFAMIGVAVEDRGDVIKTYSLANGLTWSTARLEGADKARVTEAWGVNNLPEMFLIGPEGWIVSRDIKTSRLHAAVEDLLNSTK